MIASSAQLLTFAQESIYFLNDLTNGRPVYHMPQAFCLRGKLDRAALDKAFRLVVEKHEALRTAIFDTAEGPRQVAQPASFFLKVHSAGVIEEDIATAMRTPFDLKKGEPFRADLFCVGDEEHMLLLNLHHAFGDMSSLGILFRDLSAAYSGGEPSSSVTQYGDYARRKRAVEPAMETREFWRESLKNFTAELDLPLDRQRPRMPSFEGDAIYHEFPADLTDGIKQLARKLRCSVYMVGLAALQVLIYRHTGQQEFCVATPFSDRDDPALENTIGYLINLLPVPCEVRPDEAFTRIVETVRNSCLEAYSHNSISFRQILKELNLTSDSSKPPLARVVFQYFPEMPRLDLPGLQCEPIPVHSRTSKFDLCFSLFERAGTITAEIEYDTDILTKDSAEAWGRHFETLLRSIVANPAERAGSLKMMTDEERRLLNCWNATDVSYPRDATVHQIFEEQVAAHPDARAILAENEILTYRELDERANAIAAELQGRGVRGGDCIGVCLQRSPDLVAVLLGILKVGAAFVPFDANYPKARLEFLFKDSGVRLLVTDARNARIAPAGVELLFISRDVSRRKGLPAGSATSVAYVMYTSGSTGEPKGVMVPHRAIIRLVTNNVFASFSSKEVWLAFAPVSFDASTLEIWAPLLNGGALAIYPPEFQSVEQFETVLKKFRVTSLWLTAGLFNTIVDQNVESLKGVRQLLVGGDVLSTSHVRKALDALPETQLINGYGPTENTTFTCCYSIPPDWPADRAIPIGKPIKNTQVFILDEQMQETPIGVPGELYAAGDGLSTGYLNRPELTAASFVMWRSQRLYRTGDRARFLPDGNIDFLGRRDAQVKIRGFRIEMGEVEAALRRIPTVQDATVITHADAAGGKQLVAYVVGKFGNRVDPAHLTSELNKSLPAHACPSIIIPLNELPLGPNGKVNRSALPKPGNPETKRELAAPGNSVEVKLAEIWRQILEISSVSVDDNFFHLGGESLRAMRAISRINLEFNCRLTLPRIFEAPTVRQMSRLVAGHSKTSDTTLREASVVESGTLPIDVEGLSDEEVNDLLNQLVVAHDPSESQKQTT